MSDSENQALAVELASAERLGERGIETWALVPFYAYPEDAEQSATALRGTVEAVQPMVDHVVVVNDGTTLTEGDVPGFVDFYGLDSHLGKAAAIREGAYQIVRRSKSDRDLIVQVDADFDQEPRDTIRFLARYAELARRAHQPRLLIGDRYHNMPGNLIRYRRDWLAINRTLAGEAGYRSVADLQSGFRAYTVDLGAEFARCGNAYRYGIEAEQAVIAMANHADVESIYLTASRVRDASTDALKWLENFAAMLDHSEAFGDRSGEYGQLRRLWKAFDKIMAAIQERRDLRVKVPILGVEREFYFYMPDDNRYTVVTLD